MSFATVISLGISGHFLLNVFTNMLCVLPKDLYYRFVLIIELLLIALTAFISRYGNCMRLKLSVLIKVSLLLISQILAYFVTNTLEKYSCFDIHRMMGFILMYVIFFESARFVSISEKFLEQLHIALLLVGVFACAYNFFLFPELILTFNLRLILSHYSPFFVSFFTWRSSYCLVLTICYCFTLRRISFSKKGLAYAFLSAFYAYNIFLTGARISLLCIILVTAAAFIEDKRHMFRNIGFLALGTIVLLFLPWSLIFEKYRFLFMHGESDFSNGRLALIRLALQGSNPISVLIGHGIGSKDTYLHYVNCPYGSFHSSYVDLFFEGGILILFVYAFVIYSVADKVRRSHLPFRWKKTFYSYLLALLSVSFGDAVALPFMSDTCAILSTIMFITVPLCAANGWRISYECKKAFSLQHSVSCYCRYSVGQSTQGTGRYL